MLIVLDPVGHERVAPLRLAPRPASLEGARIGFLSNGKQNATNLLRITQDRLQERYRFSDVVFIDKHDHHMSSNDTITDAMLDELAACRVVIHASGD
jgi:hypothetical protein